MTDYRAYDHAEKMFTKVRRRSANPLRVERAKRAVDRELQKFPPVERRKILTGQH